VVISLNITGNSQMSIMMALEESRNHSISRLCPKYSFLEDIKIPNINSLERIFCSIQKPYSNFIDKSFTKSLKSQNIDNQLSQENKCLMSKGIIMDDFRSFSKAFQVRQNCILSGVQKGLLDQLINQWRCKNGTV